MNKAEIRNSIKTKKAQLSVIEKTTAAQLVFGRLEQSEIFMCADKILLYHSLPDELSTHDFLDKWSDKKYLFLPRVNGVNLDILPYDSSCLAKGAFHIEEPQGNAFVDINEIELIIVPAVAYDKSGNRVGRGKGYYDRLLANSNAVKIGVCYDFQLIDDKIPADLHDIKVDMIITESRWHIIRHTQ